MKAVIIEDEKKLRQTIKDFVNEYCPQVVFEGEAETVDEAFKQIMKVQPDVVFLDITLRGSGTGFDVLRMLPEINFEIIFVTGHSHHAIEAITFNCLAYIVKPIDVALLVKAVKDAETKLRDKQTKLFYNNFMNNIATQDISCHKLPVQIGSDWLFIEVSNILRCEVDNQKTSLFYWDESGKKLKKITARGQLKEFEARLSNYEFFRVHSKHLVNTRYVEKYSDVDGGFVKLKNHDRSISVAPLRKRAFLKFMNGKLEK